MLNLNIKLNKTISKSVGKYKRKNKNSENKNNENDINENNITNKEVDNIINKKKLSINPDYVQETYKIQKKRKYRK